MSLKMRLEYEVATKGLEGTTAQLNNVTAAAAEANKSQEKLEDVSRSTLSMSMTLIRDINATRLAVVQAHKAITQLDPVAALYAFLNIVQVVSTLLPLMQSLRAVSQGTAVAQGVVATLAGMWWMIPVAIAAGAALLAFLQFASKERGGLIEETGVYYLHKGEYVVPRSEVSKTYYGPILVTFEREPSPGVDREDFLRNLGRLTAEKMRRAGF